MEKENIIKYISKKYGTKKIRDYVYYYKIGIPERYWELEIGDSAIDDAVEKIKSGFWVTVFGKGNFATSAVMCSVLKHSELVLKTKHFADFSEIMLTYTDNYNKQNAVEIMSELNKHSIIAISNIMYGARYDKYMEDFLYLLNRLMNSKFEKVILLGIEKQESDEMYINRYGELYNFVTDKELFYLMEV